MNENNFIDIFIDEAKELLFSLEDHLLLLEKNINDSETISAIFRVMHTIKGSAGIVGLDNISTFTHRVESIFELVRNGKVKVTKELIDFTLSARDIILEMLHDNDFHLEESEEYFNNFEQTLVYVAENKKDNTFKTYKVKFIPEKEIFFSGNNPTNIILELQELGDSIVIPCYSNIPKLTDINPEHCYISWDIFINTNKSINELYDVFVFVDGSSEVSIEPWRSDNIEYDKLGEILVKTGHIDKNALNDALLDQKKLGEILVKNNNISETQLNKALETQQFLKNIKQSSSPIRNEDSIRIKSYKLDNLVDLVGEIVTSYAQILETGKETKNIKLINQIERFGMLTDELRDNSMNLRMLPIGSTFSKFNRLVRDLSVELGKEITLITDGEETELDKNVIEQLQDPLVHIIRNAIDHGIETIDERKVLNKSNNGTISLIAKHEGSNVNIIIEDDGKGLDKEKIISTAQSNGLITDNFNYSDKEIFNMILQPGFSTAEKITNLSGRGVGLDVVKKQIEGLKGTVNIESEMGKYTKITLEIPLTLAIIEGLSVKIHDQSYVLPLQNVEACVELSESRKIELNGKNVISFRDQLVPFIDIRDEFDINTPRNNIEQIVIVKTSSDKIGVLVDSVFSSTQIVIKPLSRFYQGLKEVSGATIMGDGTIALVLDIEQLAKNVRSRVNNLC